MLPLSSCSRLPSSSGLLGFTNFGFPSLNRVSNPSLGVERNFRNTFRTMASASSSAPTVSDNKSKEARRYPLIDIGANLLDKMFSGKYNGRKRHDPDLDTVLYRSRKAGVGCILVTACTLGEARRTLELCRKHSDLFTTIGVHPSSSKDFENPKFGGPEKYTELMLEHAKAGLKEGKIVAVGECGLDYDRLHFSDKETQLAHFERHFLLTEATGLPMFLHDRNTGDDMYTILKKNRHRFKTGVVHSYTGSVELMKKYVDLDLYIGINGCSMKTEENVKVVEAVPLDRLMLETDAPWCSIRPSHASFKHLDSPREWPAVRPDRYKGELGSVVKMRGEPCFMKEVLQVVARIKGISEEELSKIVYENTLRMFEHIKLPDPFPATAEEEEKDP